MPFVREELRIIVAESKTLLREFIAELCKRELGFSNVSVTSNGPETIGEIVRCKPDLLILDADLPVMNGFEVMETLRGSAISARTLLLSPGSNAYLQLRARSGTFHGILDTTTSSLNDIRTAISRIADRGVFFSPQFSRKTERAESDEPSLSQILTKREMAILSLCGQLLTDDEIAAKLDVSEATVEKHRFNLQRKLDIKSRIELLRFAKANGFR